MHGQIGLSEINRTVGFNSAPPPVPKRSGRPETRDKMRDPRQRFDYLRCGTV